MKSTIFMTISITTCTIFLCILRLDCLVESKNLYEDNKAGGNIIPNKC